MFEDGFETDNRNSNHTMVDVLMTMVFLLLLIMMQSMVLPDELKAEQPGSPSPVVWHELEQQAHGVLLNGVPYASVSEAMMEVAADEQVRVIVSRNITSADNFVTLQVIAAMGIGFSLATK